MAIGAFLRRFRSPDPTSVTRDLGAALPVEYTRWTAEQTPIPHAVPTPLRSRAEQIADELVRDKVDAQPTTRRLPTEPPAQKPRVPGR